MNMRDKRRKYFGSRCRLPHRRQRRSGRWFCLLFVFRFLLLLFPTMPAGAAEPEEIFRDFLSGLPGSVQEEIAGAAGDAEATGELIGAEYLFSLFTEACGDAFAASRTYFLRLLGMVLLFAVLTLFFSEAEEKGLVRVLEMAMSVALCTLLYDTVAADMTRVGSSLEDMRDLSNLLIPAFASLFAAGGSTGTAVAAASGFTAFSLLLENLCVGVLLPLLRVLFGFTLIGVAGGSQRTDGIFRTVRQTYITLLVFLSLLLTASLSFQTVLSASADSLSARSVKFAVGNLIPVIGGSLSDTLRTLTASLTFLRSSIGTFSVLTVLMMLLPTLIGMLIHRFGLSLAASLSGMLGCGRAEKVFTDFRGIYDLSIATLSIVTVLFLLLLSILSKCGLALSGV